jgi:DNA-binding phage protein
LRIHWKKRRKDETGGHFTSLRAFDDARGGLRLAKRTEKSISSLFKTISEEGNPRLATLDLYLGILGYSYR